MCWLTPKLACGSSLKLEMWKLGFASQSSAMEESGVDEEASLATSEEDRESRVAVSVALSDTESFSEPSLAFSGSAVLPEVPPGPVANARARHRLGNAGC